MYHTEKEIFNQYAALSKTFDYLLGQATNILEFKESRPFQGITFTGCGSSYCLCRSAEITSRIWGERASWSLPAGDLMLNYEWYKTALADTLLVTPSRSGGTSEVLKALEKVQEVPKIGITARRQSPLAELVDLCLEVPWSFDQSVCQTRTVSNLYLADLMLLAFLLDNHAVLDEVSQAIEQGSEFTAVQKSKLQHISAGSAWENVVVLADGELQGIGAEAALAFQEIARLPASFHHVLDVRHGPMVLIGQRTLVIAVLSPEDINYQKDLIGDLKGRGASVLTISSEPEGTWLADWEVAIPRFSHQAVVGLPFIFVAQAMAFFKAIDRGINPDLPPGLDPWIEL